MALKETKRLLVGLATVLISTWSGLAGAQGGEEEEKKLGWANVADFGLVVTAGNSSNQTIHLDNRTSYTWENALFQFKAGGLRTKKADVPFAVGTPDDFTVIEDDTRDLDNERFYVSGDYNRIVSKNFFWLVGAGWDKDTDAGIESRTVIYGGLGNNWKDRDDFKFRTDYSVTFTRRIDEIVDPERDERFPEGRLSWKLMKKITESNTFDSELVFFSNLKKVSDYRFNTTNAFTSNINKVFALRFTLQFLYQKLPAFEDLDLFESEGGLEIGAVDVRKNTLDAVVKFTVVVTI